MHHLLVAARAEATTSTAGGICWRRDGENRADNVDPRSDFPNAPDNPTEARNDILGCFGRSDRSSQRRGGKREKRTEN